MPMNELQRKCLGFLKQLQIKGICIDLIGTNCDLLATSLMDRMETMIQMLMRYLDQNPTDSKYRTEMSRIYKDLMGDDKNE